MDEALVVAMCTAATARMAGVGGGVAGGVVDVVTDPLDGSVWVRLTSWPRAQEACAALVDHGLAVVDRRDNRLQVTGWDARALRRRLGTAMAGVDDLREEWDATAELARYHRDRRCGVTGVEPDPVEVLADVERTLREAKPLPHVATASGDVETLLELVAAAEDAYAQLLVEHVEHAAAVLTADSLSVDAADTEVRSVPRTRGGVPDELHRTRAGVAGAAEPGRRGRAGRQ